LYPTSFWASFWASFWDVLILRVPSSELFFRAAVTGSLILLATGVAMVLARRRREQVARRQELVLAESLIQTAEVMVWVLDTRGRIFFMNPHMQGVTGCKLTAVRNRDWFETFVPAEHQAQAREEFRATIESAEVRGTLRSTISTMDDGIREIEWREKTLRDGEGHVIGLLATGQDITERLQMEEELRQSQQRLNSIMDNIPQALFWKGRDLTYLGCSRGFALDAEYLGPQDLIGKDDFAMPWADQADAYRADDRHVMESGVAKLNYEVVETSSEGVQKWMRKSKIPLRDATGSVVAVLGMHEDITEHRRADTERERLLAQVREQARRVKQIMDTVPEGVILLSANQEVLLLNRTAKRDLPLLAPDYDVSEAGAEEGKRLTRLGDRPLEDLLAPHPQGLWHAVRQKELWYEAVAEPFAGDPDPEGWVLVIKDVTRERQIRERAQDQDRLAAVGQLAAGIAHDLDNIMTVIVLYAQMLTRIPSLDELDQKRLETIVRQSELASDVIEQILDFSRTAVFERRPLDLVPLVKEQVEMLERTLPETIKISLAVADGPRDYIVNANSIRIQQVLINLAVNARDAMVSKGAGELHVQLDQLGSAERTGEPQRSLKAVGDGWLQLSVSDTGEGIARDDLPHVFEPFSTTKARGRGTGLGLAQVYGIVKQHGGELDVASVVGHGTTFTVYLPIHDAVRTEKGARPEPEDASRGPRGTGETVLVVDDDSMTRRALIEGLEMLNYRALEAAQGEEALAVFERHRDEIALVLTDLVVAEMGGIELATRLHELDAAVRVVVLSGHPLQESEDELRSAGVVGTMQKPATLGRLADAISKALGRPADNP
jgi:PAS domain S-box-containing protein